MSKTYTFQFSGTKEMFLEQLNKYPNNYQEFFFFDGFIVDLTSKDIRFGVARGSHSYGYWFVPTVTEQDGKLIFSGTIQYGGEQEKSKCLRKAEDILLYICLFPLVVIVKVCLFFHKVIKKIQGKEIPKEESLEQKLHRLMEAYLNCTPL